MQGVLVTVATTPTLLFDASVSGNASYPRAAIIAVPTAGQTVFLGSSTVDTTNGFPVTAGTSVELQLVNETVYGIVAATTQTVNVLRSGD